MSFGGRFPGFDNDPFFGSRPRSVFEDDPFFNSGFPSFPMLGYSHPQQDQGRSRTQRHHREVARMDPFSMFRNMDRMTSEMSSGAMPQEGSGHYHSSSTVMHYSSSAGGEAPKVYTATSSVTQGPGGIRETRKSESNSETGMKKMAIGHHIGERGHVIERRHDTKRNETEQHREFINIDEDESEKFDREWQHRTQRYQQHWGRGINGGNHSHMSRPEILPPINDRRSRSPERERHRKSSKKPQASSDGGNAARRQQYLKDDKKVHF